MRLASKMRLRLGSKCHRLPSDYSRLRVQSVAALGVVLLTVRRSYVGRDVTHSTLLDRACACSCKNLPKYIVPIALSQAAACSSRASVCRPQDTVDVLLRHHGDCQARDKNWQTPLHVAAASNAVHCAISLVPLLSNVNVSDRAGRTSLHHAAFNGHTEVGPGGAQRGGEGGVACCPRKKLLDKLLIL